MGIDTILLTHEQERALAAMRGKAKIAVVEGKSDDHGDVIVEQSRLYVIRANGTVVDFVKARRAQ